MARWNRVWVCFRCVSSVSWGCGRPIGSGEHFRRAGVTGAPGQLAQFLRRAGVILRPQRERAARCAAYRALRARGTVLARYDRMEPLFPPNLASAGETAPHNSQLRAAFQRFPRSLFPRMAAQPLGEHDLDILPEQLVVSLLQALALTGTERVLEVGSPTAYLTALLSHLSGEVYSTTVDPELANERARDLLALGCSNVQVVHAPPGAGWPIGAPYQAIVVGSGAPEVPRELVDQLDVGGRLIIPIGDENAQMLECMRKRRDALDSETLGACRMKMLAGAPHSPSIYPWTCQSEA